MGARAGYAVVELSGELTVPRSREVRESLLKALGEVGTVFLKVDRVEEVDASFLQVVCAAHRSAVARGAHLAFSAGVSPAVREAARFCGYDLRRGCREGCVWICGVTEEEGG
jgi:anti-anti-sigma regulatory factor